MKVQELRELLKNADRDYIEKAVVEIYKQLPKGKKDEVDGVIGSILQGHEKEKKEVQLISFAELKRKVDFFIENAYAQNYFAPNRIIPKNQRPKWRFQVKGFIKDLEKIPEGSPDYADAVDLLVKLYEVLCTSCNYYLFSTEDPFRSVGIEQQDLCRVIILKTFSLGYTEGHIRKMLWSVTTSGLSRETLHSELEYLLVQALGISDVKNMALREAKVLIKENEEKLKTLKTYDSKQYYIKDSINQLCRVILMIGVSLCDPEPEVKYFFVHSKELNKEITLYTALDAIEYMQDDRVWIWTYNYAVHMGVQPREGLRKRFAHIEKTQ